MKSITTKTTKAGNIIYYMIDENGKKRQVSRKHAQEIINSNKEEENKMENTVAIMNATAEDMEAAIRAEEEAAERIESESEYKPQCSWDNPHNYETVGSPHARNLYAKESVTKKTRKKTTPAEQQQRWLENAKTDEMGNIKLWLTPTSIIAATTNRGLRMRG